MKRKGFTLIELLAVIVVLAIIALIATPIVMNTIKNAKKGAAERTADNYVKAVEQKVAASRIDGTKISDGTYNIQSDGNLCPTAGCGENDKDKITIDMSGNKPTSGTVTISNGMVSKEGTTMIIGDYNVKYNQENSKYDATEKGSSSSTIVYRWSTDGIEIGDTMNDPTKYTKDASTLSDIYLKHILDEDNKVTESYACSKLKGKEYCLTNGDYEYATKVLKKIEDAKIEGISCTFNESVSVCVAGDVNLLARPNGSVVANGLAAYCSVSNGGSSGCAMA